MCDDLDDRLQTYGNWVDEATSRDDLLDVLYDIENDLLDEDDSDDNEGGRQFVLRR